MSGFHSGVSRKLFCNVDKLYFDNLKNLDERLNLNNNFNENKYEQFCNKNFLRSNRRFKTEPPKKLFENEKENKKFYASFFRKIFRNLSQNITYSEDKKNENETKKEKNISYLVEKKKKIINKDNNIIYKKFSDDVNCSKNKDNLLYKSSSNENDFNIKNVYSTTHKTIVCNKKDEDNEKKKIADKDKEICHDKKNDSERKKDDNDMKNKEKYEEENEEEEDNGEDENKNKKGKMKNSISTIDTSINKKNDVKSTRLVNSDIISDVFLKKNVKSLVVHDTGGIDIELIENENPEFLYHTYTGNRISNIYYEYDESIKSKEDLYNDKKINRFNSSFSHKGNNIKNLYNYGCYFKKESVKSNEERLGKKNSFNYKSEYSLDSYHSKVYEEQNNVRKNNIEDNVANSSNEYLYNEYYNEINENKNKPMKKSSSECNKIFDTYSSISSVSLNISDKEKIKKYYYIGETFNNVRNGWGMLIYNDRVIFEGEYKMNNAIGYFIKYNEYSTEFGYRSPISIKSVIIMSDSDNFIIQNKCEHLDSYKNNENSDKNLKMCNNNNNNDNDLINNKMEKSDTDFCTSEKYTNVSNSTSVSDSKSVGAYSSLYDKHCNENVMTNSFLFNAKSNNYLHKKVEEGSKIKNLSMLSSYFRRNSKHKTSPAHTINYLKPPVMNFIKNDLLLNKNSLSKNDKTSVRRKKKCKTTHISSPMNIIVTSLDTDDEENFSEKDEERNLLNSKKLLKNEYICPLKILNKQKIDNEKTDKNNIQNDSIKFPYDKREMEDNFDKNEKETFNFMNLGSQKLDLKSNIEEKDDIIFNNYEEINYSDFIIESKLQSNAEKDNENEYLNNSYKEDNLCNFDAASVKKKNIKSHVNLKNGDEDIVEDQNKLNIKINDEYKNLLCENINNDNFVIKNNEITTFQNFLENKENYMKNNQWREYMNTTKTKFNIKEVFEEQKKKNLPFKSEIENNQRDIKRKEKSKDENLLKQNIFEPDINKKWDNISQYKKEEFHIFDYDRGFLRKKLRGATFPETHDDRQKNCFLFIDDYLTSNEDKFDIINEDVKLRASDYNKWSVNMLYNFLKMIGLKKEAYLFKINKIRGYHILKLTDKELKKLNINNSYVRKFVLSVFRFLVNSLDNADPLSINFNTSKRFSFNKITNICSIDISLLNKVGGGSYAQVFKAKYKGIYVACKIFLYNPKQINEETYCESYISTPRSSQKCILPKINKNLNLVNYELEKKHTQEDKVEEQEENEEEKKKKSEEEIMNNSDTLQKNKKIKKMANLEIFRYFPTPVKYRNYEAKILYSLQECKHVIKLIGVCSLKEGEESLILQYCPGGSLEKYIYRDEKKKNSYIRYLSRPKIVKIFQQVAEGMHNIHSNHFFHRDLKLSNILLDEYQNAVISDFGLSTNFSPNDSPTAYAMYGNIFYAAPEVLKGEGFFKESDVWSFAVSLWEALTKKIAYDGLSASEVFCKISAGELVLPIPNDLPTELSNLLKSMLEYDFTKRPLFHVIAKKLEDIRITAEKKLHSDIISFFDG
ncbi:tyrosine kinase-like protein, putative [Plasmodium relictum]|uniref:Tyrosine kinase-like protein, putative n=1 Tax=Plasmodium relictum TaxID=85471 RepID=A0A1J1HAF1_PLARL|nr:tyrosine kinase-like protein, putative [Plasmodium relictum]CRH01599.1 tyrosine kinase-like protein, putative [Plasmodium relictum]